MKSRALAVVAVVLSCYYTSSGSAAHALPALRVCADPDNLPFSNDRRAGFENRIADLIAAEMGARVEYTWWPQRRGFLRNTLNAHKCDVVMGLPAMMQTALTTRPYYRSAYAFVSRRERHLDIQSFDDQRLRTLRIGVQLVGDEGANSPPAHELSRRGIIRNVAGFPVYDDPARIVRAVADGRIDIAAVWGPVAGYYAAQQAPPLQVLRAVSDTDAASPLTFEISLAVRNGDAARRDRLNSILDKRRPDIEAILAAYHVLSVGEGS